MTAPFAFRKTASCAAYIYILSGLGMAALVVSATADAVEAWQARTAA